MMALWRLNSEYEEVGRIGAAVWATRPRDVLLFMHLVPSVLYVDGNCCVFFFFLYNVDHAAHHVFRRDALKG